MFHKRQNSLNRYFASEGKIAMEDILPQEGKIEESANCLAGHGQAGLKKNKCPRSTGGYGLDIAGYGQSGPEKFWTVPSLLMTQLGKTNFPNIEIVFRIFLTVMFTNYKIGSFFTQLKRVKNK